MKKINKNLTPEEEYVLRDKGTEYPFSGKFDSFYEDGIYKCKNCGAKLFKSDSKYNAGCGWPSFFEAVNETAIKYEKDNSILEDRGLKFYVQTVMVILDTFLRMGPKKKLV